MCRSLPVGDRPGDDFEQRVRLGRTDLFVGQEDFRGPLSKLAHKMIPFKCQLACSGRDRKLSTLYPDLGLIETVAADQRFIMHAAKISRHS